MSSSRIPEEFQEAMVAAYLDGDSLAKAAKPYGYSWKACWNALKRRGISPRGQVAASRISPDDEEAMVKLYLAGASTHQAAKAYGYSPQTCTNVLLRRGLTVRTRREVTRRYEVDETFFERIDTEERAYWLGFFTADGCVTRHQLVVILKETDAEHLAKLNIALSSTYPVQLRVSRLSTRTYNQAALIINSTRLVTSLARLGVGPSKSMTVRPCPLVPDYLRAPYWRGMVDGDGSIQLRRYPTVELVGNAMVVTGFHDFVSSIVPNHSEVRPNKNIFRVRYGGSAARAVANLLYSGATIALDRKFRLARALVTQKANTQAS